MKFEDILKWKEHIHGKGGVIALELYSVYNSEEINDYWMDLNHQQNVNGRIQFVKIIDKS